MTDDERIAAFLAAKGTTVVAQGTAFGVDPAIDKERRRAARAEKRYLSTRGIDEDAEWRAEEYRERVNDAYMSGGSRARDEEMAAGPTRTRRGYR